jgi:large subunit ribosomal protein L9
MKVILQSDVQNLGKTGTVVKVRDGYGRNYLIPRGLAVVADEGNVARLQHQLKVAQARAAKLLAEAKAAGEKLSAASVTIRAQAGEEGKLFGSVTNRDIADALVAAGFSVDKKQIKLDDAIRNLGVFNVGVKLHTDVEASVKVFVIAG